MEFVAELQASVYLVHMFSKEKWSITDLWLLWDRGQIHTPQHVYGCACVWVCHKLCEL